MPKKCCGTCRWWYDSKETRSPRGGGCLYPVPFWARGADTHTVLIEGEFVKTCLWSEEDGKDCTVWTDC